MDQKWLIAAAAAAAMFSTEALADWYTTSLSTPSECYIASSADHPEEEAIRRYGRDNVLSSPILDFSTNAHIVAVGTKISGNTVSVMFYTDSHESCLEMAKHQEDYDGTWSGINPKSLRTSLLPKPAMSDRLRRIQEAEERGWQLALGNGMCVPMNVTGHENPYALKAQFPRYHGQTVTVEFQSSTQATMTDLTGRNEPAVFILGKKACIEATR